jgi:ABC-type multidrug transport system permease subunit
VVYLVLAFSGGAFVPPSQLPAVVQKVAPISPFYWGSTGYRTLLEGGNVSSVTANIAVLAGLGTVLLVVGSVLMRRRMARGGWA